MRPVRKADNLTTPLCRCHEIWETLQACNGTALPLPFTSVADFNPLQLLSRLARPNLMES